MIFRSPQRILPFTQISDDLIGNPALSGKAKWLLIYILSKPPNWQVYEADIIKHGTDGRDAIRSAVQELEKAGYMYKVQLRDEQGRLGPCEYYVSETPDFIDNVTVDGLSVDGKPDSLSNNNSRADSSHPKRSKIRSLKEFQQDRNSPYSTPAEEEAKRRTELQGSP